jgi:hypothetical protein
MFKKTIAVITLLAFMAFSVSCFHVHRTMQENYDESRSWELVGTDITAVQTKAGKTFEFPKGRRARIRGDAVVGETLKTVEIDRGDVERRISDKAGKLIELTTKDGKDYHVIRSKEDNEKIVLDGYTSVSIPFSEIQLVWVRRVDPALTFLANAAAVTGVLAVIGFIAVVALLKSFESRSSSESCPFIYSFDGEEYVLDAEPYGTAICQALKRTEWVSMDNLREVDGQHRVRVANELDETQYTDELKLLAVDHRAGIKVAPDSLGSIHTFTRLLAPVRAYDQKGRDIRAFVSGNDKSFWVSRVEEKNPEQEADLRDELILEFPKPAGATHAKLLANAWTTMWGSIVAKKFLELYGRSLPQWYAEVNSRGPAYNQILNWYISEELYLLKVWVETKDGWKVKGMINGGGSLVSKDKAYILDISDVSGSSLKIKLRPPVNFWMLNYLAVDYGEDIATQTTELPAIKAIDENGQDVLAKIAAADNDCLVARDRGEWAEMVFPAPPLSGGLQRTLLVKASGYYDIHLDATGEPQNEVIDRIASEPGFAARFALKEYLRWEAGLLAKAGKR